MSSLGQSVDFRTIRALEISNQPDEAEPSEPKIRFVAGIHGNAPVGTELLLEFATFLCMNYGKNPAITRVRSFRILPSTVGAVLVHLSNLIIILLCQNLVCTW